MNYTYFNAFITNIGEDVDKKVAELAPYNPDVIVETLTARPLLKDLINNKLQPGDKIYIYQLDRFCSGLTDLDDLMIKIVDQKKADIVSITDGLDTSTETGKAMRRAYHQATLLTNADPSYGFYR